VDVLSTIVNAQMAEVVLPEEEYGGLTSLCRRAMAREPAERIASVKLFRAELRSAIENLRSEWLAQQALESLQVLERALDDGTLREAPLHQSYGACRFGFLQALEIWPENQVASQGLRRSVECMVQHELNQGFAASAARLLGDHPDPPQALLDKVARRRRIQEEREQAVAAIERTRDPRIGYSVRLVFALMIGLFWCVGPFLVHLFIPDPVAHLERSQVLFYTGGTLGLILILFYLRREVALATQINRSVVAGTLIVMSTQIILTLLSESLGIRMETLLLLHPLIWAVVALMGAALVEPATAPIGLGYLLVVIAGALSFGGFFAYIAFANLLLFVNVIVVWRRSVKHASSADR
jgi:hypothetical protein